MTSEDELREAFESSRPDGTFLQRDEKDGNEIEVAIDGA